MKQRQDQRVSAQDGHHQYLGSCDRQSEHDEGAPRAQLEIEAKWHQPAGEPPRNRQCDKCAEQGRAKHGQRAALQEGKCANARERGNRARNLRYCVAPLLQNALEDGVVHYADTAMPGEDGNLVIVGHSSNNIFNKGKYKFAFVLLSRLDNGDTFYIQKDGKRYTYQVYKKTIVSPDNVSVLGPADKTATATLITCDPPGTSTNRLVVVGEQISPEVGSNIAASGENTLATSTRVVPGNSPSLWSRLVHSL